MIDRETGRDAQEPVVGRLAPSPTGGLHLGHARTFLIAWLAARHAGGHVIMRIEDLDRSRARPAATQTAIDDLRWLGLDWDFGPDVGGPSGPYFQSERGDRYERFLESLKNSESVYPCTCTRADVARSASAPHLEDEGPTYPGTWRIAMWPTRWCLAIVRFAGGFAFRRDWSSGMTCSWAVLLWSRHGWVETSSSRGGMRATRISSPSLPTTRPWA